MAFQRITDKLYIQNLMISTTLMRRSEMILQHLLQFFPHLKGLGKNIHELDLRKFKTGDDGVVTYGDRLENFDFFRSSPFLVLGHEEKMNPLMFSQLFDNRLIPFLFVDERPVYTLMSTQLNRGRTPIGMARRVGEKFPNYIEVLVGTEKDARMSGEFFQERVNGDG